MCVCVSEQIDLPDNIEAMAAMMKDKMTPGPATFLATIPATTYIPVPQQLPTPSDTRSKVVRHFRRLCTGTLSSSRHGS